MLYSYELSDSSGRERLQTIMKELVETGWMKVKGVEDNSVDFNGLLKSDILKYDISVSSNVI